MLQMRCRGKTSVCGGDPHLQPSGYSDGMSLSTLYLKKDENIPFYRAGRASRAVQVFLGPSMAPKNTKRIYSPLKESWLVHELV